jgi:ABC-type phosphate transport system substrate-binding protein
MRRRMTRASALVAAALALLLASVAPAGAAASHSLINGSGSSWSANAVSQWIADVQSNGLQVVYTPSGSAVGRKDFSFKTVDFAVSDIGFQGADPVTGANDTSLGRPFVYLPIVAGGTSFPYHISVGGQLVKNLRLSGQTLVSIFTGKIKSWSDAAITKDNNGRALPNIPIIPVVHSEGSGSSAQFTTYLDTQYTSQWRSFFNNPHCPSKAGSCFTEYWPPSRQGQVAQDGSDGVINFIASKAANGAIGYDEYSYALGKNYPVAKIENTSGYFTLPTQYNVAVALTKALINYSHNDANCPTGPANCYLLQDLHQVYSFGDKRTYPLSSYSYMIIPTSATDQTMTTAKRQTLVDYLSYSLCQGQKEMGPIGYSPLPINLVTASFQQAALVKTADPKVQFSSTPVAKCNNPTFVAGQPTRNYLAEIAPYPPACDKFGAGPCSATGTNVNQNPGHTGGSTPGATASGGPSTGPSAGAGGPSTAPSVDPDTGQTVGPGDGTVAGDVQGSTTTLPVQESSSANSIFAPLAALLLILALLVPPFVSQWLPRRKPATATAAPPPPPATGPTTEGGP